MKSKQSVKVLPGVGTKLVQKPVQKRVEGKVVDETIQSPRGKITIRTT